MSTDQRYISRLAILFGKDFITVSQEGEIEPTFLGYFQDRVGLSGDNAISYNKAEEDSALEENKRYTFMMS